MSDFTEVYEEQNKILDIYLKNVGIGTAVIEVNSEMVGMQIREYLYTNHHLRLIDYATLTGGIINFLRETGQCSDTSQRQICIYDFPTDSEIIDFIQSLNISRELLRRIDRLVLIMPTLLVEQIKGNEPNLRDYIGLFLDYNRRMKSPFEPVFDVPFKKCFTKQEQMSLKSVLWGLDGKENLQQYFRYINQFYHRRLQKHECHQTLLPAFERLFVEIHDHNWDSQSDYIQATEDLLYQTATVLAVQRYYELALERFEMMLEAGKGEGNEKNMYTLHGLEGISYCLYGLERYEKTEEVLLQFVSILQSMENDHVAWLCRIYSNCSACYIRMKDYQKAEEILNHCFQMLEENEKLNAEREARIRTNLMICQLEQGEITQISASGWEQYMERVKLEPEIQRYHYTNCLLMDAWYKGVLLGANQQALSEAGEALKNNRELVTENSYELAVNYAVLEVIYGQLGDTEKERMAEKKKRNILRVRI